MNPSSSAHEAKREISILVTGAGGQLGARVLEHLRRRAGTRHSIGASTRDSAKAEAIARTGAVVRRADFDDRESLRSAFANLETLVLISTPGPKEERVRHHASAIRAAEAIGVRRIVYTSFLDVTSDTEFATAHRETEKLLGATRMDVALVRNAIYADFLPMLVGDALRSGNFQLPARDGRLTFVSRDELAEGIAAVALNSERSKPSYEFTGPVASDFHEVARTLSGMLGKPVRYEAIDEKQYVRHLQAAGLPDWLSTAMGEMFRAVGEGYFARTTTDLELLIGRPAQGLRETLATFVTGASAARR